MLPSGWLVLLLHLPPHPSSVRVRVWRRLRAVGAVALKNSAYLLPATPDQREHFEWLAQEVRKARGEATLLAVDRIDTLTADQVQQLFRDARNAEYRELAARYRRHGAARPSRTAGTPAGEAERVRLARELERIREIDFFGASGYEEVKRLQETLDMHLKEPRAGKARRPPLAAKQFRGRTWVTRPRPHVDRLATAWLIRRFIDPKARFRFAPPDRFPKGAVSFDAPDAAFGHQGEACTFETVLERFGLKDPRLAAMAEIVHDIDLRDERFGREETRGLDLALRSLRAAIADDQALLAQGLVLFDGLYATLERRAR